MACTFFLGGVRSGKTGMARKWAEQAAQSRLMVATCHADDAEMARRIALHKKSRGPSWQLLEEPLEPVQSLNIFRKNNPDFVGAVVLDSLGMWINNLMQQNLAPALIMRRVRELASYFSAMNLPCAIISEECSQGLVGTSAIARKYVDLLGLSNQIVASLSHNAVLVVAGLPVNLKGNEAQQ